MAKSYRGDHFLVGLWRQKLVQEKFREAGLNTGGFHHSPFLCYSEIHNLTPPQKIKKPNKEYYLPFYTFAYCEKYRFC